MPALFKTWSAARLSPLSVGALYTLIAVLWVVLSDRVLGWMGLDPGRSLFIQTFKGVVFVSGSGVLIYLLTKAATAHALRLAQRADESEARYRSLVETSPDGVAVVVDGAVRFANHALARILGAPSVESLVGKPIEQIPIPNADHGLFSAAGPGAGAGPGAPGAERSPIMAARLVRPDGGETIIEVSSTPIVYDGHPGALVLVHDIGERLAAQAALKEAEQRYRRLASNIPGAIIRVHMLPSGDERVIYTSPGCVDVWEVPPETFSRSPEALWDAMHPDDRPRIRATVGESIRTLTAWSGIWRIRTPSGAEKWLQGFGQPARGRDGVLAFDAVVFDITGTKRAEDAARAASSRLAHVLQRMSDGFFLMDPDLRYVMANESGAAMLGLTPAAMVGRTAHELFPGASLERWADTCRRVMRDRTPETTEGYFEALGKWFEARLDATDDGLAIFIRDIGDRKRAELRQQFMMRELDHRVKNNLAAVLAITESSLRESESLEDFSESFVGRIRAMASMHSLLAARRWEGVGLVSMLQATLSPYADLRSANRVELSGADLLLPSNAAPALCMTVHELATNAAKHGALASEAGRVRISWTLDPATGDLRFRWSERDGPRVPDTIEPGFGMDLLQGVIPYELNGEIKLSFDSHGLDVDILVPGDSMRAGTTDPLTREGAPA